MPPAHLPDQQPTAANRIAGGTFSTAVQSAWIGEVTIQQAPATPSLPVPRQLPRRAVPFIGRAADLARIAERFDAGDSIVVLHGPPGAGKSRLATEALTGHGGPQLYTDLRQAGPAAGPDPMLLVLAGWLRALGHPGPWVSTAEAAAWWRTVTATDPPPAVLLDNATDGPLGLLLPTVGPVVVTSLIPLRELAADGARHHGLAGLEPDDARTLLEHRADPRRLEDVDAARLVAACHHLPAPIGLIGARLALEPDLPPAALLIPLTTPGRRRGPAAPENQIMATTLDAAARGLPDDLATALRTLMMLPFSEAEPALLAAALRITPSDAEARMRTLAQRCLLTETDAGRFKPASGEAAVITGGGGDAAELAARIRRAAVWWLAGLTAAERQLTPTHRVLERESAQGDAPIVLAFATDEAAWEWLSAQALFVPEVLAACAGRWPALLWQCTHALWPLWHRQRDQQLRIWALELSIPAVKATGSRLAVAEMHSAYCGALRDVRRFDEALAAANTALVIATEDNDLRGQGQYEHELGATLHAADRPAEALPHLTEALALRARDGYSRGAALNQLLIGACHHDLGEPQEAREQLQAARRMLLDLGDRLDAGRALAWLGRALFQLGLNEEALDAFEQAETEAAQVGARIWQARPRAWSAPVLDALGRPEAATAALRDARKLYAGTHAEDVAAIDAALADRDR